MNSESDGDTVAVESHDTDAVRVPNRVVYENASIFAKALERSAMCYECGRRGVDVRLHGTPYCATCTRHLFLRGRGP